MKIYRVNQFNAIQFKRGGYTLPFRTGWVAVERGVGYGRTKQLALRQLHINKQMEARV